MKRIQKVTAVVSIVTILILAVLLGIFLWKEHNGKMTQVAGPEIAGQDTAEQQGDADEKTDAEQQGDADEKADAVQMENVDEKADAVQIENMDEKADAEQSEKVPEMVSMFFTGDVMLGSSVRSNYNAAGIQGVLSEYLIQEMTQADITMVNEEFPFSNRGTPMPDKQYTFRIDPAYISAFHEMGIDVVSLANNHALDYGTEALEDTFAVLEEAGIPYVGAGSTKERAEEAAYIECGGRTVGFLSASRVIPVVEWNIENKQPGLFCTYDSAALVAAIEKVRQNCDYLVVYVHWGVEKKAYPEEYQRVLAQAYIEAGADLVIGAHPHVPQGIEYYQGKPIVYSLGNFIFNPNMGNTYALKLEWDENGESNLYVIPIATENSLTSELTGQARDEMFHYIEEISYDITVDENGLIEPVGQ